MAKKKGGGKAARSRGKAPTVTLRIANEGSMAKKKGGSHRGHHRKGGGHHKKEKPRRRRRNPSGFLERTGRLLGLAAVSIGTGVAVVYGASKIMPGSNVSLYGIPIATFLIGAAVSTKYPTFGVGIAAGAAAPLVMPVATKVLTPSTPATTAAGIARAYRSMRAIDMGRGMRAVDMSAVDMGYVAYR